MNMDTGLSAAMLPAGEPPAGTNRVGWQNGEEAFLFSEVARGRAAGLPLKAVFERVAAKTGRKPNSIRNYYYARVKESGRAASEALHSAAFVPFSEEEMRMLMRTVLTEQAKGVSVRACTLAMGKGDTKTMLRYQNKYRSLLRTNPAFVKKVLTELAAEGVPAFDPYAAEAGRYGARGRRTESLAAEAFEAISRVRGADAQAFFRALSALAASASGAETERLQAQCAELRERLLMQEHALAAQRERFGKLLALFRQMMEVNRAFLGEANAAKSPALGAYVRDLARSVEDCERILSMIS
ncbi:MAG: hypothetical protein PUD73_07995 [bacterium]|nr:hypothetical protein [bacterium]